MAIKEMETQTDCKKCPFMATDVEIVTCKDCKYWDKKEKYCKYLANIKRWFESEYDAVYTSEDFYCRDAKR